MGAVTESFGARSPFSLDWYPFSCCFILSGLGIFRESNILCDFL